MLASRSLNIDAEYYIRNLLIPPLSRIFNLVGADVENWYDSMPRIKRAGKYDFRPTNGGGGASGGMGAGKMRIDSHFKSSHCVVCGLESSTGMSLFVPPPLYQVIDQSMSFFQLLSSRSPASLLPLSPASHVPCPTEYPLTDRYMRRLHIPPIPNDPYPALQDPPSSIPTFGNPQDLCILLFYPTRRTYHVRQYRLSNHVSASRGR